MSVREFMDGPWCLEVNDQVCYDPEALKYRTNRPISGLELTFNAVSAFFRVSDPELMALRLDVSCIRTIVSKPHTSCRRTLV